MYKHIIIEIWKCLITRRNGCSIKIFISLVFSLAFVAVRKSFFIQTFLVGYRLLVFLLFLGGGGGGGVGVIYLRRVYDAMASTLYVVAFIGQSNFLKVSSNP